VFIGLAAGATGVIWWSFATRSLEVLRFSSEGGTYAGGVGSRGELWRAALAMWRNHPILGVGAGNYELLLPQYGVFGVRTHANSWYLSSLAEGGTVLFGATLALIAGLLATFVRGVRATGGSPWVLAALAASCALAVHQIADYLIFYPKIGGSWWLLVGLGAAALASGGDALIASDREA
jgi:O-antigen ligase